MKLLFTGDINFRGLSEPNSKMCSDILAEVLPYFEKADFRIINLETQHFSPPDTNKLNLLKAIF